ncbi:hypothetical protein LINGRAHAP2_LOCUS4943, partial [Linum grandiflorum]
VWHFRHDGLYTVPSGYRLAESFCQEETPKFGPTLVDSHLWATLWGSSIQPKLKFFAWKIFQNILPLQDTLAARSITVPSSCPVCAGSAETLQHLLCECIVPRQLGDLLGYPSFLQNLHPVVLWRRLHQDNPRTACKLIYFWWRLWKSRNLVVFDQLQLSIPTLARLFARHWDETDSLMLPQPQLPLLNPPSQCFIPTNPTWDFFVDAAVKNGTSSVPAIGGLGLVIQAAGGSIRAATGAVVRHIANPLILEMMAIRRALLTITVDQSSYPGFIIIHLDCAEAVKILYSPQNDIRVGSLFLECRLLLRSLPSIFLRHVR